MSYNELQWVISPCGGSNPITSTYQTFHELLMGVFVQWMLRVSQVRRNFTPDNHPEKGERYRIVVDVMAECAGAIDPVPPLRQYCTTFVPTHPSAR